MVHPGAQEGPRHWWAPCLLELPAQAAQPTDAWFYPRNGAVPQVWAVPLHRDPESTQGRFDPDAVALMWLEGQHVRCPWVKHSPFPRVSRPSFS